MILTALTALLVATGVSFLIRKILPGTFAARITARVDSRRLDDLPFYLRLIQHDLLYLLPRLDDQDLADYHEILVQLDALLCRRIRRRTEAGHERLISGDVIIAEVRQEWERLTHAAG